MRNFVLLVILQTTEPLFKLDENNVDFEIVTAYMECAGVMK